MNLAFRHERGSRRRECRFRDLLVVVVDRTVYEITGAEVDRSAEADRLSGLLTRYFNSAGVGDLDDAVAMRAMLISDAGLPADQIVRLETDALVELFTLLNIRYRNSGHAMETIGREFLFLSNMIARLQMAQPVLSSRA